MENNTKEPLYEFLHAVDIGDYKITYMKLGSGPTPIFAFPGLLGSLRHSCEEIATKIGNTQNGQKYTLYSWDPPGYFLSRPILRKDADISFDFDMELGIQLMKHLEPSKSEWIILGYSAGSQSAMKLAMKYPEMVQKLIIWGAWDLFDDDHLITHLHHRDLRSGDPEMLNIRLEKHGLSFTDFEACWHKWMDMIQREHFNRDKVQWVKKFEKVKCPTLIIAGSDDRLAALSQSQYLHQYIKNAELKILEGAQHFMQQTHCEEMYAHVLEFLN